MSLAPHTYTLIKNKSSFLSARSEDLLVKAAPHIPPETIGKGLCRLYLSRELEQEPAAPVLAQLIRLTPRQRQGKQGSFPE